MSEHAAESARLVSTHTHAEYGVIVDRTTKGLGYWLAETFADLDRARAMAAHSEALFGFPAEVKRRTVTTTRWEPLTPPGDQATP